MSNVRQIRKLDALPEARVVHGVTIEPAAPITPRAQRLRYNELRDVLDAMHPGEWIVHLSHGRAATGKLTGKKFTAKRQDDGRWRIQRTA